MDLNTMMRQQAQSGLQAQLDAAVTNGDTEAARKVTEQIAALAVSNAPIRPPYTGDDIRAEMEKQPWFGVDAKKSGRAVELGKHLDIKKFATAALFAEAVIKAVDEEFKTPPAAGLDTDDDTDDDAGTDDDTDDDSKPEKKPAARKTDGPGEGDNTHRTQPRRATGPWTKMADAPGDIQKEIRRQAEKFLPANATDKQRDAFHANALGVQYRMHQQRKGK